MILMIDNYDSFTYNLVQAFRELGADMQVIRERPEPVLSAVAQLVTEESPTWTGTPTELAAAVGSDLPPNKLTMKLGINASRLFNEYGISFEKTRTRSSRQIMLRRNVTGA